MLTPPNTFGAQCRKAPVPPVNLPYYCRYRCSPAALHYSLLFSSRLAMRDSGRLNSRRPSTREWILSRWKRSGAVWIARSSCRPARLRGVTAHASFHCSARGWCYIIILLQLFSPIGVRILSPRASDTTGLYGSSSAVSISSLRGVTFYPVRGRSNLWMYLSQGT